jgi:lambda family phage portal protein
MTKTTWLDRAIGFLAPRAGLRRMRARMAADLLSLHARHYEAASTGRRTQGWNRSTGDANLVTGPFLSRLREAARDLVRNNGHAESALTTIGDHVVGWGIKAKPVPKNAKAADLWKAWAETTACDSDGRNDFYGLQKLVLRTVAESGEVLVRRRFRRPEDELPIPLQLQVLDPDYIDTMKTETNPNHGRKIINGVEYDALGRRAAYWLFSEHPGSLLTPTTSASRAVPAESILHVFKQLRPGQVRGVSWFATVLLRFKDFDEYEDATLMKQKIAACLAVITSDTDGTGAPIGTPDATQAPEWDSLEPGMIINAAAGRSITVVDPPSVAEYADYSKSSLHAIATGLGVTYEDLTGDYSDYNFSSARMSRLRHQDRVDDWRWRTLIPQFCDPAWAWAMQSAQIMGLEEASAAEWTPPPIPFIEPDKEGLAISRNIRAGLTTLSDSLRERGYDPIDVLKEIAADNKMLDELGLILDSDARNTTQAGQPRVSAQPAAAPPEEQSAPEEPPPAKGKKPKPNGKAVKA